MRQATEFLDNMFIYEKITYYLCYIYYKPITQILILDVLNIFDFSVIHFKIMNSNVSIFCIIFFIYDKYLFCNF